MRRVVALIWIGLLFATLNEALSLLAGSQPRVADPVGRTSQIDSTVVTLQSATPTRTPTPINVGNFVWDDIDQDGRQDAGEPGISGVTVQLWNSTKTALLDSDVTNASGTYTVVAPLPGNYRVRVLLPNPPLDQFSPKDQAGGDDQDDSDINPSGTNFGFTDIYVFANNLISITTIDAGIIKYRTPTPTRTPTPVNIGNLVWHDLNANGVQDAGEPGIPYVQVQLWNAAKTALLDTAITTASGNYTVTAPFPGDYRVRVLLPPGPGVAFTVKDSGANDQIDSDINPSGINVGFTDVISIASNVISITTVDAGLTGFTAYTPTATVTQTVTNTPLGMTPTATGTPTATTTATTQPGGALTATPLPTDMAAPSLWLSWIPLSVKPDPCANIDEGYYANVTPNCMRVGESFDFEVWGFEPQQEILICIALAHDDLICADEANVTDDEGYDYGVISTAEWELPPGDHILVAVPIEGELDPSEAPFRVLP